MTYDKLLRHLGGEGHGALTATARKLGKSVKTVAAWKRRGIPRGIQFEIHAKFPELPVDYRRKVRPNATAAA